VRLSKKLREENRTLYLFPLKRALAMVASLG
jgi:hypothetical protein